MSRFRNFCFLATVAAVLAGCGHGSASVAPSAIAANPSSYDEQDVTVSGTVKNPVTRKMRRGTATRYQICDNSCVTVIQFGEASVTDGSKQTVTGRFHTQFGRKRKLSNVIVVGGRPGR
jgi:hypothetical protein